MTATVLSNQFRLTEKQREAIKIFGSDPMNILLYGGSRSTKTFTSIRNIVNRALIAPKSRHAALRFRFTNIKQSVIYDTFPKVMELCFPQVTYKLNKSDWFVRFPNKSEIWFGGLDDKERTEKILGNEYATIFLNECSQISYDAYLLVQTRLAQKVTFEKGGVTHEMRLKMLLDENPPMRGHWTYRLFIEGVDPETKRKLKDQENYAVLQMNPADNVDNLPASYIKTLDNMPKRKRDRFYLGLFGSASENALWTSETIEGSKVDEKPTMSRIVVAVDPSGTKGEEGNRNDDVGILVVGLGIDGNAYVLEDLTINAAPAKWGKVVAEAFTRWEADRVIGEINYGGAMVEFVLKTANSNIPYRSVHASRSKMLRAEPVSALHETGKVKLYGTFPELEDEMLSSTTQGYTGDKSPNRLDAFVFGVAELFPSITKPIKKHRAPVSVPNLIRV